MCLRNKGWLKLMKYSSHDKMTANLNVKREQTNFTCICDSEGTFLGN